MNRFTFIGRTVAEPEIRHTSDGKPVARFRFAVNRNYKRDGEPEADFFQIVMFGNPAERFEKLNVQKGTKLLLEGEIRNNNYTDQNGVKHYDIQFVGYSFEFLEKKADGEATQQRQAAPATQSQQTANDGFMTVPDDVEDDNLPFN